MSLTQHHFLGFVIHLDAAHQHTPFLWWLTQWTCHLWGRKNLRQRPLCRAERTFGEMLRCNLTA